MSINNTTRFENDGTTQLFSCLSIMTRSDKLLSLFSVVQFTNSECIANVEDNTLGVCVTSNEVRKNIKGKFFKQQTNC